MKVQRPNLRPTIEADLSLLRFFVQRVLDAFPEAAMFDLEGMVREFERSLMRELDFEIEATEPDHEPASGFATILQPPTVSARAHRRQSRRW